MELSLALAAEGPTDFDFFLPLLRRLLVELCAASDRNIEVAPIKRVEVKVGDGESYWDVLGEAVDGMSGAFHILLFHVDGAGDPRKARSGPIASAESAVRGTLGRRPLVPVVPVREMEAWAVADGAAIRSVTGTRRSDAELGLPRRPRDVEKASEPKELLKAAVTHAKSGTRSRKWSVHDFLTLVGEVADLEVLRQLPSFAECERDLRAAMRDCGFL